MTDLALISVDVEHGPRAEPAEALPADRAEPAEGAAFEQALDLQRVWLAAQRRPWASLALIPIGAGVRTRALAAALAEVGQQHLGDVVVVHDATSVTLGALQAELGAIAERARCAERAIVALPPLLGSPSGLALARATDAAILCIALGSSAIAEAEQVLEEIGKDRVLGSVILEERKEKR